jgi:multisubunit Na+/H+ antiporter MnhG subunit
MGAFLIVLFLVLIAWLIMSGVGVFLWLIVNVLVMSPVGWVLLAVVIVYEVYKHQKGAK